MSFSGCGGHSVNPFLRDICRFIGETVTIFTTSGGASGCGFTGVIISVNSEFVRLVNHQGTAPANPLAENICGEMDNDHGMKSGIGMGSGSQHHEHKFKVGSVCDIPVDRIAAFCHNAV